MTVIGLDAIKSPPAAPPAPETAARDEGRFADRLAKASSNDASPPPARSDSETVPSREERVASDGPTRPTERRQSEDEAGESSDGSGDAAATGEDADAPSDEEEAAVAEATAVAAPEAPVNVAAKRSEGDEGADQDAPASATSARAIGSGQALDAKDSSGAEGEQPPANAEARATPSDAAVAEKDASSSSAVETEETPPGASPPPRGATTSGEKADSSAAHQRVAASAPQAQNDSDGPADDDLRRNGQNARTGAEKGSPKTDTAPAPTVDPTPSDAADGEPRPEARAASASTEGRPEQSPQHERGSRSIDRIASGRHAAARGAEAAQRDAAQNVDAGRFVSRVSRAFQAAEERGGVVQLRLSPPELGALQIKLTVTNEGALTASLDTDNAAARNLLLDNLPALRERLAEQDIRVEKFDVNVGRDGGGRQDPRAGGDGTDPRSNGQTDSGGPHSDSQPSEPSSAPLRVLGPVAQDQINLIV